MNVFSFTGNLGKDCQVNSTPAGTTVCNFNVAVKSGYGDREKTEWVRVALWGKQAEGRLPEYLLKGQQVAVSGELSTREHEGKTYLEVRANSVSLVGGKVERSEGSAAPVQTQPAQQPAASGGVEFDDDMPF